MSRPSLSDYDPMRTRSDDAAVKQGYVFDADKAFRAQDFVESLCRLYVGRWAGQLIELMPYQTDFLWPLYGWVDKHTGFRRFREAYLETGKKNGKSPFSAALSLYHLIADGENAPEVLINATSREQASIIYRNASAMLSQEPEFAGLYTEIASQKRIIWPENNGVLVANSADAPSKQGVQASLVLFDELAEQPNRQLWDTFRYAGRSRLQPLLLSITNAGEPDNEHPCYGQHKRALAVESGALIDTRFLGHVYGPREPDPDINDRRVWRMANPAMGFIVNERDIEEDLEKAKREGPAALQNFKRFTLSIWEKIDARWVGMDVWNEQEPPRSDEEIAQSGDIWTAGLDMSAGGDLCAYVRVAGTPKDGIDVKAHFWIPSETALKREQTEHLPYREWAEMGYVTLIDGAVIDPLAIRDWIIRDAESLNGKLKRIYADEWNSHEIAHGLRRAGYDFQFIGQGYKSMHPPIKTCESLIARRLIRHGNHPILDVNMANAVVDDNNPSRNKRLVKPKGTARIDGAISLVEAVAGLCDVIGYDGEGGEESKPTINDGRIYRVSY